MTNEQQIAWQKSVIREEMRELQEQWDKAINDDWLDKEDKK